MNAQLQPAAGGETLSVESFIASHPLFAGLKPRQLSALNENAMRMSYKAGEIIFSEGDPANRFYLIQSGKVAIESSGSELAPPMLIEAVGPGDLLGWSWLFPPYYCHFDARAIEPTTAIFFYGTRLRQLCDDDSEFGYELMKRIACVVIRRLQAARRRLLPPKP